MLYLYEHVSETFKHTIIIYFIVNWTQLLKTYLFKTKYIILRQFFNEKKTIFCLKAAIINEKLHRKLLHLHTKCIFQIDDDNNSNNKIIRSMWNHDHNIIMSIVSHAIISLIVCYVKIHLFAHNHFTYRYFKVLSKC